MSDTHYPWGQPRRPERIAPTADELPDELDAPAPPRQVAVGSWTYPADLTTMCVTGCGRAVLKNRGMCDDCIDLYNAQS